MIYKSINEKYDRIFKDGLKEKNKQNEVVINENDKKAADRYYSNKKSVDTAIKELISLIKKHEEDFKKEGEINWSAAGDMGRLKVGLLDMLEYMKPMKPTSKDVKFIQQKGKEVFRKMGKLWKH